MTLSQHLSTMSRQNAVQIWSVMTKMSSLQQMVNSEVRHTINITTSLYSDATKMDTDILQSEFINVSNSFRFAQMVSLQCYSTFCCKW